MLKFNNYIKNWWKYYFPSIAMSYLLSDRTLPSVRHIGRPNKFDFEAYVQSSVMGAMGSDCATLYGACVATVHRTWNENYVKYLP